jgi:diguanylate cyclase (GGDEF)-like protein
MNSGYISSISKTIILLCLVAGQVPCVGAAPVDLATLKAQIAKDRTQAIPQIREALKGKDSLPAVDRLWLLEQLSEGLFRDLKYDEALAAAHQGQRESASIPVQRVAFGRLAMHIFREAGNNKAAIVEYEKISPMLATLSGTSGKHDGKLEAAHAWRVAGKVLASLGQLPEAMELEVRALRVYDAVGNEPLGQSDCLNEIAQVYFKTGRLEDALREIERAIQIAEQAKVTDILSRYYLRKAHFLASSGKTDAQYQALMTARELAKEEGNTFNQAVVATNLADVALQRKDYRGALRFVDEALPLVEKSGDRESLLVCWINKGLAQNRLGQKEGLVLLERAIAEFSSTVGKKDIAADIQGLLAEEFAFNRDYEKAYAAAVDFKKRSDAVRSASDQKRIADADARYQADKKQRQIEQLEQEGRTQRRVQMLWALAGVLGLLTTIILLVSRLYLKRAYSSVQEMSLSDPLTGLRNRRYLASRIDEDLAQASRHRIAHEREHGPANPHNTDIVFIMIDMDHFKAVNDVHGHAAGDAVLKQFSAILMEEVRDSDTVVRWGGEEFLIVAKQASGSAIHLLAERVRARVAAHDFDLGNGTVLRKTCSIGFASYPFPASDVPRPKWEDVVALADQCLYAAKASGRDIWVGVARSGSGGAMAQQRDVRLGVREGLFELQHSAGRDIVWPEEVKK